MAIIRGLNTSFLNHIELNEPTLKAIRFNESELYMLKMCIYKGLNFSSYVKSLIIEDIKKCNNSGANDSINKDSIRDLIREVLKEDNIKTGSLQVENENIETKVNNEYVNALGALGIKRR